MSGRWGVVCGGLGVKDVLRGWQGEKRVFSAAVCKVAKGRGYGRWSRYSTYRPREDGKETGDTNCEVYA